MRSDEQASSLIATGNDQMLAHPCCVAGVGLRKPSERSDSDSKNHHERRITPSPEDLLMRELLVWKPPRLNTVKDSDYQSDNSEPKPNDVQGLFTSLI